MNNEVRGKNETITKEEVEQFIFDYEYSSETRIGQESVNQSAIRGLLGELGTYPL